MAAVRSAKQVAAQRKASLASARARRGSGVLKKAKSITTTAGTITYPAGYRRTRKSGGSLYKPFGH